MFTPFPKFRSFLQPMGKFRSLVQRERLRSDRTSADLSLLVLTVHRGRRGKRQVAALANVFRDRLRSTDDVGWLEFHRAGRRLIERTFLTEGLHASRGRPDLGPRHLPTVPGRVSTAGLSRV